MYVGEKEKKVYFIDYENYENNDFYVAEEVTIRGENKKRPDIVIYINGIAIGVIELKRSTVSINEGIKQNLDNQSARFIERFFTTVQFIIAGNDTEGLKYATTLTPAKYYLPWIEDEKAIGKLHEKVEKLIDKKDLLIDQQIPSLFEKERLIDLIDNFIIFDRGIKKVPRYNQYFGVSNAREFLLKHEDGIIWHTQGSGKSLSMVFIAKWILSNMDNSRVLIFTDRKELDKQIQEVFNNSGEKIYRAKSCNDFLQSLNDYTKGRLICSLIHKVGIPVDEESDKNYAEYVKELNNFKIEVIRKRVKNINLKVYPNLKIMATIPEFMDIQTLKRMIILKEEWIKKQLDKFQEQNRTTRRNFVSGEDHYINGKRYILKVYDSNNPSVKVENNKRIVMNVRKSSSLKNKENLMNRFYKEKLQEKLQVFIPIWEEKIGVKANKYKIRKMKNMWGSCNITKKEINFNLNLAKKKDSEIQ